MNYHKVIKINPFHAFFKRNDKYVHQRNCSIVRLLTKTNCDAKHVNLQEKFRKRIWYLPLTRGGGGGGRGWGDVRGFESRLYPRMKSELLMERLELGRGDYAVFRKVSVVTSVGRVESVLWRTQKPTSPLNLHVHPSLANVINCYILMTLILMKMFPVFSTSIFTYTYMWQASAVKGRLTRHLSAKPQIHLRAVSSDPISKWTEVVVINKFVSDTLGL